MWPYGVLWALGCTAVVLTVYQRVTSHLKHRKNMAEIRNMRETYRNEKETSQTDKEQ